MEIAVSDLWGFERSSMPDLAAVMRLVDGSDRVDGQARLARPTNVAVWPLRGG
jgi:hypothetical protein